MASATRASKLSNNRRLGNSRVTRAAAPSVRACAVRLGQADFGAGRLRGRLTVGQVDDAHAIALARQRGQRPSATDLDVVGVRPTAITSSARSSIAAQLGLTTETRNVGLRDWKRRRSIW